MMHEGRLLTATLSGLQIAPVARNTKRLFPEC